jgi:YfiH family protein
VIPSPLVAWAPSLDGARAVFTGRGDGNDAGVSRSPFDALNLARHVGDRDEDVRRNREAVSALVSAPLVFVEQVHGTDVRVLTAEDDPSAVMTADAMVTVRSDVALAIMVADCVPVLLSDASAGVVGAAHAGRRGLLDGVLARTVGAMVGLGARAEHLQVAIGPSICPLCYEVPAAMCEDSGTILPATVSRTRTGTPSLDLRAGAVQALVRCGVDEARIQADPPCTLEDERFFSYRRSHRTGRFAGVVRRA